VPCRLRLQDDGGQGLRGEQRDERELERRGCTLFPVGGDGETAWETLLNLPDRSAARHCSYRTLQRLPCCAERVTTGRPQPAQPVWRFAAHKALWAFPGATQRPAPGRDRRDAAIGRLAPMSPVLGHGPPIRGWVQRVVLPFSPLRRMVWGWSYVACSFLMVQRGGCCTGKCNEKKKCEVLRADWPWGAGSRG